MDEHRHSSPPERKKRKAALIDHTYRDYSRVEVSDDVPAGEDHRHLKGQPNFPAKLHEIMSNPEYRHIIGWMPHGRSWMILDNKLLADVVCSKHFSHNKFESFNRSVNGWGFKVNKSLPYIFFTWRKFHVKSINLLFAPIMTCYFLTNSNHSAAFQ